MSTIRAGFGRTLWAHTLWAILAVVSLGTVPKIALGQTCAPAYTTEFRYDSGHRVVGVIHPDPDGAGPLHYAAIRNTYNTQGVLVTIEKGELQACQPISVAPSAWPNFAIFQTQLMIYDDGGRQIQTSLASGGTTYSLSQTSYDNQGRIDCVAVRMDPTTFVGTQPGACTFNGPGGVFGPDRVTKTTYDATTHVLKIQRAFGDLTGLQQDYATYTYTNNLQTTAKDANGNLTSYAYDGFGRLTDQFFPSSTSGAGVSSSTDYEHYGYDYNGNRTSLRKRDTSVIGYQYDALDRMTFKDIPGGTVDDVYYEYDLRGLQTSTLFGLTSGVGPSTYGIATHYDGFGRVDISTNNSDTYSRTLKYTYDADSNRLKVIHPDNVAFSYGYDGLDRTQTICESTAASTVLCTASASPIITIAYDNQGRSATLTRGANVANSGYLYDPVSRLQSMSHNLDGTQTTNDVVFGFTYTPSSQIATRNISLGAFANVNSSLSATYSPNGLNQYTTVSTTSATWLWDANGNLKYDGSVNYTYDVENRLTGTTGGKTAILDYDPKGRLLLTSTGSAASETHFLYDGDALVAEYNSSGGLLHRYVHGPGLDKPLVWYKGTAVGPSNRFYYFQNHQGSIAAIADNTGAKYQINTYDVYGIPGGSYEGRFQYTGQIRIPEIGMYYYKARIYNPTIGRFLQTDPIGYKDDLDLYTYVGNDPLDRTDPSGNLSQGFVDFSAGVGDVALAVVSLGLWDGPEIRRVLMDDAGSVNTSSKAYEYGFLTGVIGTAGLGEVAAAGRSEAAAAAPKDIVMDSAKHPEATAHAAEAQAAGQPSVLTVDRAGAKSNRTDSLRGTKPTKGKDRDEYPPAMFKEGGQGASVKPINPSDNRGAGASMARQCSTVKDGEKVRVVCK